MPKVVDLLLGLAAGVGLYFVSTNITTWIFEHFDGWVGWYPVPPGPQLASDGLWIALGALEVVVVAVGEESIFRGILHRGLRTRYPVAFAAAVSAALFALVHSYSPHMPAISLGAVALALAPSGAGRWRSRS